MKFNRRTFFKTSLFAAAGLAGGAALGSDAAEKEEGFDEKSLNQAACLMDTTLCFGCRKCEEACNRAHGLPEPDRPFTDRTVLRQERRPSTDAFTVVNEYPGIPSRDQKNKETTTVKVQCMHCLDPSCVSACIVGALTKAEDGSVTYDPDICIGCRYCMVACPFQIPAYEYHDPAAPKVRKCDFCFGREGVSGANPACAAVCPMEAIVFGKRGDLLELAHGRIQDRPDRYIGEVYGESEVGGTSWLYLLGRSKSEIGLLDLPREAPPRKTEAIQHGIFNYGAIPLAVYGALGGLLWFKSGRSGTSESEKETETVSPDPAREGGEK